MNWEDEVKKAAGCYQASIQPIAVQDLRSAFEAGVKWAMENQIDPDRYDLAYMDGYAARINATKWRDIAKRDPLAPDEPTREVSDKEEALQQEEFYRRVKDSYIKAERRLMPQLEGVWEAMKNSKRKKIKTTFDRIENTYPDKSLEWVIQMTCDEMERYFQHPIDFGDVMESITEEE